MLDTEGAVEPEQQEEFNRELAQILRAAARTEKVGQTILHLEAQAEFCRAEAKRISEYGKRLQGWADRIREGVLAYIMTKGFDAKGKLTKLNGKTVTMSGRSNPPSVEVLDPEAVPPLYKTAVVEMPLELWYILVDQHPHETAGALKRVDVEKRLIKEAIQQGRDVPGADLNIGTYSLRVG
jgi:hypothetical protein